MRKTLLLLVYTLCTFNFLLAQPTPPIPVDGVSDFIIVGGVIYWVRRKLNRKDV